MKRLNFGVALLLFLAGALFGQAPRASFAPGQLLAQHRIGANPSRVAGTIAAHGAAVHYTIPQIQVWVLRVPEAALDRVQRSLAGTGLFTFVERDAMARRAAIPNDPNFTSQWHLGKIRASDAWSITTGAGGPTIAMPDSGVNPIHEDLVSKLVPGWNFLTGTSNTADVLGHGTATAGTAGAATNNGIGVAGAAWANPIMPLVVLNSANWATYSDMARAITYAADHGARIVSMSLAGSTASSTLQSAVHYAWNKGTVLFAAAGNYTTSAPYYPAACDNALAISSTGASDNLSTFSNFGTWIDFAAPGESILTTNNSGGYSYWSGTSFSTPIAAGVGALVLSIKPSLTATGLVTVLQQNSDDLGPPGFDTSYGWGRINAYKAVLAAQQSLPSADTTPPTVSISSPMGGSTLSGAIQVQGTATDNVAVTKVELYIDSQLTSTTTTPAFSFSWNTATAANGSHTLTVKAYDGAGNVGSVAVTVTVSNIVVPDTQPPTVTITSPSNGAVVSRVVTISVTATDNVAVSQVSIYVDGILTFTGTAAPYSFRWNTRKADSGSHVITATAWDTSGNSASATPETVFK